MLQVPPIIVTMVKNSSTSEKYDLRSVQTIFTGAAPLGKETAESLQRQHPKWKIRQGYGKPPLTTTISRCTDFHP